jgi:TRAP-type mannitol/chloroaromatic compound transport system substrate-binding protein
MINDKAFNSLTPEYKAILEAAAAQAHIDMQAKYDAKNPAALKQLVGSGAKLREFPKDIMQESFKSATKLYDELSSTNENWKKIYADYSKFRADQNLWFRFAEAKYDDFMQAQKL